MQQKIRAKIGREQWEREARRKPTVGKGQSERNTPHRQKKIKHHFTKRTKKRTKKGVQPVLYRIDLSFLFMFG